MGGTSTSQQSVLLVNTGNRLVNFLQKFGKQWELESLVIKIKSTVLVDLVPTRYRYPVLLHSTDC